MKLTLFNRNAVKEITEQLNKKESLSKEASLFLREIENGNLNVTASEDLRSTELGRSLASIREHLAKIAQEEEQRNWHNAGLAKFGDILRNKDSLELRALADDILSSVIKYVNANQGALFVHDDSEPGREYLEMLACYAYDRKKYLNKRIAPGDGLAGQCLLEKELIYMRDVPPTYVSITSGLGQATPRNILISPLMINDKVFGVLELASFDEFTGHKIDFIRRLSENIAATIKNVQESERVLGLLNSSQQQAEELRAQEEEMRQNMEELQATQEEMYRKTKEVGRASSEMMSVVTGINATMATIEFGPDGTVLTANGNFLRCMKYTLPEIQGKHHRMFVPEDIINTEEYGRFWSRLAAGESFTGMFRRLSSDGKTVWLNAIYNPIMSEEGLVTKVVKFASDITREQEGLAEAKGIISGINATMATIEFTPEGIIKEANENFLRTVRYNSVKYKESITGFLFQRNMVSRVNTHSSGISFVGEKQQVLYSSG